MQNCGLFAAEQLHHRKKQKQTNQKKDRINKWIRANFELKSSTTSESKTIQNWIKAEWDQCELSSPSLLASTWNGFSAPRSLRPLSDITPYACEIWITKLSLITCLMPDAALACRLILCKSAQTGVPLFKSTLTCCFSLKVFDSMCWRWGSSSCEYF